jgi:hypothetical protein
LACAGFATIWISSTHSGGDDPEERVVMAASKSRLLFPDDGDPERTHRKPSWIAERSGLIGRAWIERFGARDQAHYNFQDRDVFFTIERDDRLIATGKLIIWRCVYQEDGDGGNLEGFVRRGDENSHSDHETAVAVARVWGSDDEDNWWIDNPFCYGDLCSFDRLVIDAKTSADIEVAWQIIDALLTRIRRGTAVMVLKAFPLEYEGKLAAENRLALDRRRRALIRLYQRRIGFELVPQRALADEGWMLRMLNAAARPDAG